MARTSPYIAGNPVGREAAFIGRDDVLTEVRQRLRSNSLVLYGQRRIGKTSILQHLGAKLPTIGPYLPVYFDLQDKATKPLGEVLLELAMTIADAVGAPEPAAVDAPERWFRDRFLPSVLQALPTDTSLVLLFDEFDVLAGPGSASPSAYSGAPAAGSFFPYLRALLAKQAERLRFIFVIGRNIDDLEQIALSLFKGLPAVRVSLLSRADAGRLVRLSEAEGSLAWLEEAVEKAWELTHGHPFLLQQLCALVWDRAIDAAEEPAPVTGAEVLEAVAGVLEAARYSLEWLWNGLPPAERVVASALAAAGPGPISRDQLERVLHDSGVRVIIRELQKAPELLQEWDLIEPEGEGYRFRVELLRKWIQQYKPLQRVQQELDFIEPTAEALYRAAEGFYRQGELARALGQLREAVGLNPNHLRGNELMADILISQGALEEARALLEKLWQNQPAAARPRLVQVLVALLERTQDDEEKLLLCTQVLEIDPRQKEALALEQEIWLARGERFIEREDFEAAITAYERARRLDLAHGVRHAVRVRAANTLVGRVRELEGDRQYAAALTLVREGIETFGELVADEVDIPQLERKTSLEARYQQAVSALQQGDSTSAISGLLGVLELEPRYKDASALLHQAVTGVDLAEAARHLEQTEAALNKERVAKEEAVRRAEKAQRRHEKQKLEVEDVTRQLADAQRSRDERTGEVAELSLRLTAAQLTVDRRKVEAEGLTRQLTAAKLELASLRNDHETLAARLNQKPAARPELLPLTAMLLIGALIGGVGAWLGTTPHHLILQNVAVLVRDPSTPERAEASVVSYLGKKLELPIKWTSDDVSVATVDGAGDVRGVASGKTRIRASFGPLSRWVDVEVRFPEVLVATPTELTLTPDAQTATISAQLKTRAGEVWGTPTDPTWTTSDAKVATVEKGTVTRVGPGQVVISVAWNALSADIRVESLSLEQHLDKQCKGGDMASCARLATSYYLGDSSNGIKKSHRLAAGLYKKTCEAGNFGDCYMLGLMYGGGQGVAYSAVKAAELYKMACDGGWMAGCGTLGESFDIGWGVKQNNKTAADLYRKACEAEVWSYCGALGMCYEEGQGVSVNPRKARELKKLACDHGVKVFCE